jgi:hypothetical protein
MALREIESGQAIALSYAYEVDTDLDFGKVPADTKFLNLYNNIIYFKDLSGKVSKVGNKGKLTSNYNFDSNSIAYAVALGGI